MSILISNLLSMMLWDFKLQLRYYFWIVGFVLSFVWFGLLSLMPSELSALWIPVLLFVDICAIGVFFVGGMLYLDRSQGTMEVIAVMPIATSTWILSRILSLSILCSVFGLIIIMVRAESVVWIRAVPAVFLSSALYTSLGFLIVCPFKKLMNYILIMALTIALLNLPLLGYLEMFDSPLLWLLPTQPVMQVLAGSLGEMSTGNFVFALGLLLVWLGVTFFLCIKAFSIFVSQRMGT